MIKRGLALKGAVTQFQELWLESPDIEKLQAEDWDTLEKV
jgi:hypothetical protein